MFRQLLESHATCESQRLQLKRKIEELEGSSTASSSTNRILSESPAPLKKTRLGETIESPTVVRILLTALYWELIVGFSRRQMYKR